jgi:HlyD family secretion protein
MKKRLIAIPIVVAVAAAGVYLGLTSRTAAPSNVLKISGNIEVKGVELSFNIAGKTTTRLVSEGMPIKAGQVVATLDTDELEHELELKRAELGVAQAHLAELTAGYRIEEIGQAKAALARARAEAAHAEAELMRQKELRDQDVISSREYEVAETAYHSTQAQYQEISQKLALLANGPRKEQIAEARERTRQAEAAYGVAKNRLEYATLASPLSGVVLADHIEPGEHVAPGTPVVTVADLSNVWLRGFIDEAELGRVKLGQRVRVTTDGRAGTVHGGRISFIAQDAEFTPKSVQTAKERVKLVYRLKVDIENQRHELKPGMPADAQIELSGT